MIAFVHSFFIICLKPDQHGQCYQHLLTLLPHFMESSGVEKDLGILVDNIKKLKFDQHNK